MEKQVTWTTKDGREVKITIQLIKTKKINLDGYKDVIDLKPANYEIQVTARLNGSFEAIGINSIDAKHPQYAIGVRANIGRIGIVQANLDKINDAIAEIKASPDWQAKLEAEKEADKVEREYQKHYRKVIAAMNI